MNWHLLFNRFAAVVILWVIIYNVRVWSRYNKAVSRLFERTPIENDTIVAVEEALRVVNEESSKFMFSMNSVASRSFRGEKIVLVHGLVGYSSSLSRFGTSWSMQRSVYAVADSRQAEWMRRNHDVFKPAFEGSSFSVFWVTLSLLK